jgi:ABC-type transporter lipoprotein component MlaA
MNTIIGLGGLSDPARHVAKVRISLHNASSGGCSDV